MTQDQYCRQCDKGRFEHVPDTPFYFCSHCRLVIYPPQPDFDPEHVRQVPRRKARS